jgi:N-acetylated-alpha-linked acidic dipeptidase
VKLRAFEDAGTRLIEADSKLFAEDFEAITAKPRAAGTDGDLSIADFVKTKFKEYGLEVTTEEYEVVLPWPLEISVELVSPKAKRFHLGETGFDVDPDSFHALDVPPFNSFSPSGDVIADVVYANYGRPEDLDRLEGLGVSLPGKIALVRYGEGYRGTKVVACENAGMAGVLFYADPAEEGFKKGKPYPNGPWENSTSIQRGCVLMSLGDPLTPGWGAVAGARRLDASEVDLPKIPSTPISFDAALAILKSLAGAPPPEGWKGGLEAEYKVGPGPAKISMHLSMDYRPRRLLNVFGKIEGSAEPEHLVILGAHRDSWGRGATDNGGGQAALLEVARTLKALRDGGFRPRRTILLASWDAEETGLMGSTEWLETRPQKERDTIAAYLNADMIGAGDRFYANASPQLKELIRDVAGETKSVGGETTLLDGIRERLKTRKEVPESHGRLKISNPWSGGSDHWSFVRFAIPCTGHGFFGDNGLYHTGYDTFCALEKFVDPGFRSHLKGSAVWFKLALRIAGAEFIPFDFSEYGDAILDRISEVEDLIKTKNLKPPEGFGFGDLRKAAESFRDEGRRFLEVSEERAESGAGLDDSLLKKVSESLMLVERSFLESAGTPERPTFRHLVYFPGRTGQAAGQAPLPAISGPMLEGNWEETGKEIKLLESALKAGSQRLTAARKLLEPEREKP